MNREQCRRCVHFKTLTMRWVRSFFCVKGKKEKPGKFVRIFFFDQLRQ